METNYVKRSQKDYSLNLKLQIVQTIEQGELSTTGAQREYGIQSRITVVNRLRKYGNFENIKNRKNTATQVVSLDKTILLKMPKLGTRKLYYLLKKELEISNVGRDKLFTILKANHMLIKPKRSYHITTNSHHRFRKHKNLTEYLKIVRPEQV